MHLKCVNISIADYELGTGRKDIKNYLEQFTKTFCRRNQDVDANSRILGIQVYFLGLFDTVNSISLFNLPKKTITPPKVHGTAKYIRHAVAVDESRVKFKPALLVQDQNAMGLPAEDIKEAGHFHDRYGGLMIDRSGSLEHIQTSVAESDQIENWT